MKIKNSELRKLNSEELQKKLVEIKKDLIKVNAQIAAGTVPENSGNVKNLKKTMARILTIKNEKKEDVKKTNE
jgi:large subunit ribosomal protein L29